MSFKVRVGQDGEFQEINAATTNETTDKILTEYYAKNKELVTK